MHRVLHKVMRTLASMARATRFMCLRCTRVKAFNATSKLLDGGKVIVQCVVSLPHRQFRGPLHVRRNVTAPCHCTE
jgi:hypothetical protein